MASDAHLYGIRKPKNTPKDLPASSSLAFTSTLSSLLSSAPSNTQQRGRTRPSKKKEDIFTSHNKGAKKRAAADLEADEVTGQLHKRHVEGVDDAAWERSKRKMEDKAKRYKELKAGAEEGEDSLVNFDQKWAEGNAESSSDEDDGQGEMVDYDDEYGRARRGTRAEAERMAQRITNRERGAAELDRMSARPAMPSNIIYGDTVQTAAFNPDAPALEKMEEIAAKRDRSATPPEARHYEADKEFRIKGVGFYTFSKDEGLRGKEMVALEREREETERIRRERENKKEERRRQIEERRKAIGEKRAKKQADSFLEGMNADRGEPDG